MHKKKSAVQDELQKTLVGNQNSPIILYVHYKTLKLDLVTSRSIDVFLAISSDR